MLRYIHISDVCHGSGAAAGPRLLVLGRPWYLYCRYDELCLLPADDDLARNRRSFPDRDWSYVSKLVQGTNLKVYDQGSKRAQSFATTDFNSVYCKIDSIPFSLPQPDCL